MSALQPSNPDFEQIMHDLLRPFAWIGDLWEVFSSPAGAAAVVTVSLGVSLYVTRSFRRTLAAAATVASLCIVQSMVGPRIPGLALTLLPIVLLTTCQASYWAATKGARLEGLWTVAPTLAIRHLLTGTILATVGMALVWGNMAFSESLQRADELATAAGQTYEPGLAVVMAAVGGLALSALLIAKGGFFAFCGFLVLLRDQREKAESQRSDRNLEKQEQPS